MKIGFFCLLFLVGTMTACQRAPEDANTPAQGPASTVGEPVSPTSGTSPGNSETGPERPQFSQPARDTTPVDAKVVNVRLSNQGDTEMHTIGMPTEAFGPKDTVYAEIESTGSASGYTLYTTWVGTDGSVLSDYGMRVDEAGMKRTVVSLSKPDGWASGTYRIKIAINGEEQEAATFTVQ